MTSPALVPAYVALPRGIARRRRRDGHGRPTSGKGPHRADDASTDIPDVHDIERASFPVPWPAYAFRQELETNRLAHYLVVRAGDETVAYAGIWLMVDEAHVTTFAVLPDVAAPRHRRRG